MAGSQVLWENSKIPGRILLNDFGIIRKTDTSSATDGLGCMETTEYTDTSNNFIAEEEFELLLTNGRGNFDDQDQPINVMSADARCGIDGTYVETSNGSENGWIDPNTGLYRQFEGGIAAADESCSILGSTAASGVSPSEYTVKNKGRDPNPQTSSEPCTFPTECDIATWNRSSRGYVEY